MNDNAEPGPMEAWVHARLADYTTLPSLFGSDLAKKACEQDAIQQELLDALEYADKLLSDLPHQNGLDLIWIDHERQRIAIAIRRARS